MTLPDGFQVGVTGLDGVLAEVIALELEEESVIKDELLARISSNNYVSPSSEEGYRDALYQEYLGAKGKATS